MLFENVVLLFGYPPSKYVGIYFSYKSKHLVSSLAHVTGSVLLLTKRAKLIKMKSCLVGAREVSKWSDF